MTFKLAGIVLIIMFSGLTGFRMAESVSEHGRMLKLIRLMTEKIYSMIEFRAQKLSEIISELSADSSLEKLRFIKKAEMYCREGKHFSEAWEEAVIQDYSLSEQEADILIQIGNSLGKTDKSGQLSMLRMYSHNIDNIIEEVMPEIRKRKKLFSSLGVLTGIFVSVLLI